MTESDNKNVSTGTSCGCKGTAAFLLLFVGVVFGFIIGFAAHDNLLQSYVKLIHNYTKSEQIDSIPGERVIVTESTITAPKQDEEKKKEEEEKKKKEEEKKKEDAPKEGTPAPAVTPVPAAESAPSP
jgi:hypothetical protein